MVAVQGVPHRAVAVAAAEDDGEPWAAVLELPGQRERGHVLHERAGEPDDVRFLGEHFRRALGDELGRVDPHVGGGVDAEAATCGVLVQPGDAPALVLVQHTREDPVTEAVEDRIAADRLVVTGAQPPAGPLEEELRPAQRAVELTHIVVRADLPQQLVQQAHLERGQIDRVPRHGHQLYAHTTLPRRRPLDIPLTLTFPPGQRVGGRFSMTAGLRFVRSSSRITTFLISTTLPWSTTSNSLATQSSSPYEASHAPHKNPGDGAARPPEAVQHVITESGFGVFGVALLMALDREGGNAGQSHGHLHRRLICAVTPGPRS